MSKIKLSIVIAVCILVILILLYIRLNMRTTPPITQVVEQPTLEPTIAYTPSPTITRYPTVITTPLPSEFLKQMESPFDAALFEYEKKFELEERPDVTVANHTPFQNQFFTVQVESVNKDGGYFKIIVTRMSDQSQTIVEDEFRKWLLSLEIPQASIKKLRIEYRKS